MFGITPHARLSFVATLIALLIFLPSSQVNAAEEAEELRLAVTFLGTGTPSLDSKRYGAAILVQAGDKTLLFDVGRGATIRLSEAGFVPIDVDAVFLTHFHSDHVSGLPDFFLSRILIDAGREGGDVPLRLFGPHGTKALADGIVTAFAEDLNIRRRDERSPEKRMQFRVTEMDEGLIYREGELTVTMFAVDHGEEVKPSVGYRIDYGNKAIVLSGDTRFDPGIAEQAVGADLLIHETALADAQIAAAPRFARILAHHTTPADVGRIFSMAAPKLGVLSHIGMHGNVDENDAAAGVRSTYDGPFLIAADLLKIDLSGAAPIVIGLSSD